MADRKLTKEEKHRLLTEEVASLFSTVGPADVLFKNNENGKWYLGDREIAPQQLIQYSQEAEIIQKTGIWKEMEKCLKYLSNRQMFLKAESVDDLLGGKMLLFHLNNVNKILDLAITLGNKVKKKV